MSEAFVLSFRLIRTTSYLPPLCILLIKLIVLLIKHIVLLIMRCD